MYSEICFLITLKISRKLQRTFMILTLLRGCWKRAGIIVPHQKALQLFAERHKAIF